jgi:hypothetical protein
LPCQAARRERMKKNALRHRGREAAGEGESASERGTNARTPARIVFTK